jgi:hypothetical protein
MNVGAASSVRSHFYSPLAAPISVEHLRTEDDLTKIDADLRRAALDPEPICYLLSQN